MNNSNNIENGSLGEKPDAKSRREKIVKGARNATLGLLAVAASLQAPECAAVETRSLFVPTNKGRLELKLTSDQIRKACAKIKWVKVPKKTTMSLCGSEVSCNLSRISPTNKIDRSSTIYYSDEMTKELRMHEVAHTLVKDWLKTHRVALQYQARIPHVQRGIFDKRDVRPVDENLTNKVKEMYAREIKYYLNNREKDAPLYAGK